MPLIDAHTHAFPPEVIREREKIAVRDPRFAMLYSDKRARMVDEAGLTRYMTDEHIDHAVVTAFPFKDRGLIRTCNDYLLTMSAGNPKLIPFVMVDPHDEDFALTEIERCLRLGARGIGELAFYDTGFGHKERQELDPIAGYAETHGLPLMVHVNEQIGHAYHGKTKIDFQELVACIEAHQELTLLLPHLGGGICFYEFMPEIKKRFSHVYYDLAAVPLLYSREVYQFVTQFMPDRVLFGSDYPLLTYGRYEKDMQLVGEEARQKVLYQNARRLFGDGRLG
jgi:predicted TIM-barrel fold metal-dependent hydrolase